MDYGFLALNLLLNDLSEKTTALSIDKHTTSSSLNRDYTTLVVVVDRCQIISLINMNMHMP